MGGASYKSGGWASVSAFNHEIAPMSCFIQRLDALEAEVETATKKWGAHVLNVKLWGCGNEMILYFSVQLVEKLGGLSPPNLKSGRADCAK